MISVVKKVLDPLFIGSRTKMLVCIMVLPIVRFREHELSCGAIGKASISSLSPNNTTLSIEVPSVQIW